MSPPDRLIVRHPRPRTLRAKPEKVSHGHPAFATPKGIYAALEEYAGELSICVKVGLEIRGVFLNDSRYYKTPYTGNKGWVSLKVQAAPLD